MELDITRADIKVVGSFYKDDGNPIELNQNMIDTSFREVVYAYSLKAIVHGKNTRNLFEVTLMALENDEVTLCGGRFVNYVHPGYTKDWAFEVECDNLWSKLKFDGVVDWIASNLAGKWTMFITPYHVSRLVTTFVFESHVDAMHFSLRWR